MFSGKYSNSSGDKSPERGQGILEYALIIGLFLLAGVAFFSIFGPDIRNWIEERREQAEAAKMTPTPVELAFEITETGTFTETLDTETIPIGNCDNDAERVVAIRRTPLLTYAYVIEEEQSPEVEERLIEALEEYYSFQNGHIEQQRVQIDLTALPNARLDYPVEWLHIWVEGEIAAILPDGSRDIFPFRFRSDLDFRVLEPLEKGCEP